MSFQMPGIPEKIALDHWQNLSEELARPIGAWRYRYIADSNKKVMR